MARGAVAVWQMSPTAHDPEANLRRLGEASERARDMGATIVVTPELALTGYDVGPLSDEETSSSLVNRVSDVARRAGVALVVGLALRENGVTANGSVVIDKGGVVRAVHRKVHLFGGLDRSRFAPGDSCFALAEVDGLRIATLICYDIEFPEPVRAAALAGAHLLAVPTANMAPWSIVNDLVVPVRAFENQLYVAYANHCGREGDTVYVGGSLIAAPDGSARRAETDGEELVVLEVDTEDLERHRAASTHLADRRPDLYSALTAGGQP